MIGELADVKKHFGKGYFEIGLVWLYISTLDLVFKGEGEDLGLIDELDTFRELGWYEKVMIVVFSISRWDELSWFWGDDSKVVRLDVLVGLDDKIVIGYISVRSNVDMNGDGWLPRMPGSDDIWLVRFVE